MIRFEWGLHGVERAREDAAAIVIVDVLSFSTAVDVATARGARVHPCLHPHGAVAEAEAERLGAVLAAPKRALGGAPSLSPASLRDVPPGLRLLLPSLNGSRLSMACGTASVFAGCLRNASAVAAAAAETGAGEVAVIAAGERWPDDTLRPALEDLLGAGAIIAALQGERTPEAQTACEAFQAARADLPARIGGSVSGQELVERGFALDVELAVEFDVSRAAPRLGDDGAYGSSSISGGEQ